MNAPLDTPARNALLTAWRAQPIIDLPATWQAPEGIVGAFYRALERRCITHEPFRGLGNVESASAFQPKPNSFDLAQYTVVPKDGSRKKIDPWKAEFKTDAPWTYLQALKLLLLALAKAGATATRPARIDSPNWPSRLNGERESPNVHLHDVIDYLAKLEDFVISYSRTWTRRRARSGARCTAKPASGHLVLSVYGIREAVVGTSDPEPRAGRQGSR